MRGSYSECPKCGNKNLNINHVDGFIDCEKCGKIVEERVAELSTLYGESYVDEDLYVVADDLNSFSENITKSENDPFDTNQFIAVHSEMSLQQDPLFTATSRTYSGVVAEFERCFGDCIYATNKEVMDFVASRLRKPEKNSSTTMDPKNILIAHFHIMDLCNILGLGNEIRDLAIKYVRSCALHAVTLRNRNVEALASAAVILATRTSGNDPRTLQEVAGAVNLPPKDIGKYLKHLQENLQVTVNQPSSSGAISNHMTRFCKMLQIDDKTQKLASYIGETILNSSDYTRRNPLTISAAAIYLAATLEDVKITQADICKVTGLTGVTLRKVYKELLSNVEQLLPKDYVPPNMVAGASKLGSSSWIESPKEDAQPTDKQQVSPNTSGKIPISKQPQVTAFKPQNAKVPLPSTSNSVQIPSKPQQQPAMGKHPIPQFPFPLPNPPVDLRFLGNLGKLIPPPIQYNPVRIAPYGAKKETKTQSTKQPSSGSNVQDPQKTAGKRPREEDTKTGTANPPQKKFAPPVNLGNIPVNTQLVQNVKPFKGPAFPESLLMLNPFFANMKGVLKPPAATYKKIVPKGQAPPPPKQTIPPVAPVKQEKPQPVKQPRKVVPIQPAPQQQAVKPNVQSSVPQKPTTQQPEKKEEPQKVKQQTGPQTKPEVPLNAAAVDKQKQKPKPKTQAEKTQPASQKQSSVQQPPKIVFPPLPFGFPNLPPHFAPLPGVLPHLPNFTLLPKKSPPKK